MQSTRLQSEELEAREVPAVTAVLRYGALTVIGTSVADTIHIRQVNGQIRVGAAGFSAPASAIRSISVDGLGGNDRITLGPLTPTAQSVRTQAYINGGAGNDVIDGGRGRDELDGGTGNDVINGGEGNDRIWGSLGHDRITGGAGNDLIFAGGGNNTVDGGDGNDEIYGGLGNDTLWGGTGDDSLSGASGSDHLDGNDGDDTLWGYRDESEYFERVHSDGIDNLIGGEGDDSLHGGAGDDILSGGAGNDSLYGGAGVDSLDGSAGLDGLFGGKGNDTLTGGEGADRFLLQGSGFGASFTQTPATADETDQTDEDVWLGFINGNRTWADPEIERVDAGLALLHHRTNNTRLLKLPDGRTQFLYRQSYKSSIYGSGYAAADNNSMGTIRFYDAGLELWAPAGFIVIHEIGHNWDSSSENSQIESFRALSGWRLGTPTEPGYTRSGDWWYLTTAQFPTDYARNNPHEDFADSLSEVFSDSTPEAPAKVAWMNEWLDSLKT